MVGATVVRYSFGVGLFHSFLDAGLSRRSRTTHPYDTVRDPTRSSRTARSPSDNRTTNGDRRPTATSHTPTR